jgi:RimJ/RimL family protein N-acetyltransferase
MCFEIIVLPEASGGTGTRLPIPVTTARLQLRPLRNEDILDLVECVADEDSYRFLDNFPPDEEGAREWLAGGLTAKLTDPQGYLSLVIQLSDSPKLIGCASFFLAASPEEEAGHRRGTFSIMVHPEHRSQGYGTEAVSGLLKFAFEGIHLHDIRTSIDSRNLAARRMAEKAGMIVEGEFVEDVFRKGEWASTAFYRLLASEYKPQK